MSFCGRYSLEIYLIHEIVFRIGGRGVEQFLPSALHTPLNFARIPEYLLYATLSMTLAPLLNKTINASSLPSLPGNGTALAVDKRMPELYGAAGTGQGLLAPAGFPDGSTERGPCVEDRPTKRKSK